MRNMIGFELRRCMRGRGTKAALGIAAFLAAGHFLTFCIWWLAYQQGGVLGTALEYLEETPDTCIAYPACLYEGFIGGEGYTFWNQLYFYLIPLLAALPFGSSFFRDERTGYLKNIYTRVKKRDFLAAKGIVTLVSGAVSAAAPYVMSFLFNALYVPAVVPNEVALHSNVIDRMAMSEWYYLKPWLYFGAYLLLIMLCGGAMAVISLLASFVAGNRLVVLVAPFLLYYSLDYLCMQLGKEYCSICRAINPMQAAPKYYVPVQNLFPGLILLAAAVTGVFLLAGCRRKKIY